MAENEQKENKEEPITLHTNLQELTSTGVIIKPCKEYKIIINHPEVSN
jgi:hypothetical protein